MTVAQSSQESSITENRTDLQPHDTLALAQQVVFVKNIIVTPAGILFMPPIAQQQNHMLRKYGAHRLLKISLRDVDLMRVSNFEECIGSVAEYFRLILDEESSSEKIKKSDGFALWAIL